jgi:glycosyltransferase involved in cell wall biosynthesis
MQKLPELSIFFPFWNEEKNIELVVEKAVTIAPSVAKKYEIIIVDDGSTDKTLQIAEKLAKKHSEIKVVSHGVNRGYGAALRSGFEHARYEYIVFTDGDLQFDFTQVTKFVEKISQADIVIGYREKRQDTFFRHILMLCLKIWDYVFFRFHVRDIDCGFKMFKRSALEEIMPLRSEGAMITTEILAKSQAKKLKIK